MLRLTAPPTGKYQNNRYAGRRAAYLLHTKDHPKHKIMNRLLFVLVFFCTIINSCIGQEAESKLNWLVNFEQAKKESETKSIPILMRFGGSDWCANCWRLDEALFETEAFAQYATDAFVLLNLDFPQKKENQLPEQESLQNRKLLKKYNPKGFFPAVLVLNTQGEVLGQMSVAPNSAEGYISQIKSILNSK